MWRSFDEATPVFSALATTPSIISIDEHLPLLECFVVLIYDHTRQNVNEARKHLFSQKGRQMDALPRTQAALVEHIKRAAISGWSCLVPDRCLKLFLAYHLLMNGDGFKQQMEGWEVEWTKLPQACHKCACKKGCISVSRQH